MLKTLFSGIVLGILCVPLSVVFCETAFSQKLDGRSPVMSYTTTADQKQLFAERKVDFQEARAARDVIRLDTSVKFQSVDGFGAAITGSTCYNLLRMEKAERLKLLINTFAPVADGGLGYSYVRISIGCSDFSLSDYSLCDEPGIENFALQKEETDYVIPILKDLLKIHPELKIIAAPWSCPPWMKVNNLEERKPYPRWTSGQLNPECYQDYATYFVKFVQAMKENGIGITAVTPQNEPLNRGNSASLFMTWQEQRDFIKTALGPKFKEAGLETQIIAFDHNYNYDSQKPDCKDQVGYPLHLYADPEAAQYITGAAYHSYGGNVRELERIHTAYPDKNLYFTEASIGLWNYSFAGDLMWSMREIGLGTLNRHCKAVIVWNFMLDEKHSPFRPGGCSNCLGAVDIDSSDYKTLTRNSHYYTIGHLSKVILPGADRIQSEGFTKRGLHYAAFANPDETLSIVLLNDTDEEIAATVEGGNRAFPVKLPPKSVGSYRWYAGNR